MSRHGGLIETDKTDILGCSHIWALLPYYAARSGCGLYQRVSGLGVISGTAATMYIKRTILYPQFSNPTCFQLTPSSYSPIRST